MPGIYLNINTKGYKNMAVGETFELNSFRNWFAIESFMNAKVALPEMHYQVIDVNGNASDVVTITPNALNSNVAVMEAKHEGTAIVLVTYDAMTHMAGQTSTASHRFSAIWPELTGVFVVNVGADGSAIQTNMNLDRMDAVIEKDEARQLDAEHDILFYTGTEGASYSFKPEAGCTVSVLRPTVTAASMTYSGGFTNTGVTTAEDGTVTVSGLITGRNIIKVTKGRPFDLSGRDGTRCELQVCQRGGHGADAGRAGCHQAGRFRHDPVLQPDQPQGKAFRRV